MGSDNLFHKRKGKPSNQLNRRTASKEATPVLFIVCEGAKTEPQYFNGLRNLERLSTINVKVCGDCGSAPISVVDHALELFECATKSGEKIEEVFCVFDKDNHESYFRACALIEKSRTNGIPITAVTSIPCFEYWILLHFTYHRAPYQGNGKASIASLVMKDLKPHIAKYEKGMTDVYKLLKPLQADALANSVTALADMDATGQDNPTTQVHLLVSKLLQYAE